MRWRERDGIRWLEAELPGARAAFSTRTGGLSAEPYESLNLAILTGDRGEVVRENRHRLATALDRDPNGVLIGRQVHGAEVRRREDPPSPDAYAEPGPRLGGVDGQATSNSELSTLVFVADCLPVALAGPGGVATIHCGWRGMAAGVVERGVEEVGARAAAIGPGIGLCCYEVGPEVIGSFESLGPGVAHGRMLALREVARRLLARAGVERVEASELCTSCHPELFFSHRRDGERTGRQAGVAWVA